MLGCIFAYRLATVGAMDSELHASVMQGKAKALETCAASTCCSAYSVPQPVSMLTIHVSREQQDSEGAQGAESRYASVSHMRKSAKWWWRH